MTGSTALIQALHERQPLVTNKSRHSAMAASTANELDARLNESSSAQPPLRQTWSQNGKTHPNGSISTAPAVQASPQVIADPRPWALCPVGLVYQKHP